MTRIVLDTNVLVASAYNERSASRRIVEACLRGGLKLVVSPAVQREYDHIVPRAVRRGDAIERIEAALAQAECLEPSATPRVVAEDPEDDKLLAVAVAGGAVALVTNDEHLLAHDPYRGVRIVRPSAFYRFLEQAGEQKEDCT
jgi:putative PIN family toxin of toxin-antitoxin system